jgi:hypothetical protein
MRMLDVQKFDRDRVAAVSSTPWSIHTTANPDGVFVEKAVKEDTTADIAKVRKIYIRQADFDAFGYTPACKKCQSILGRGKGETSAPHSDICRARLTAEISKTPEGEARIAQINERADRFIADRIQEADQHAPQGGLPVMMNTLFLFPSFCRSILLKLLPERARPPLMLFHRLHHRQLTVPTRPLTRTKFTIATFHRRSLRRCFWRHGP